MRGRQFGLLVRQHVVMSWYFRARQRRRLLDPDHVVFQPEVGINVLLGLEMPGDDPRPVR